MSPRPTSRRGLRYLAVSRRLVSGAAIGALAWLLSACGDEAVNVLSTRDAGRDSSADASPSDVTRDGAFPDVTSDGTVSPDVTRDGASDGAIPGCLAIGGSCSFAGQCCSLSCPQNASRACASGPLCHSAGEACDSNADCCANRCQGAVCLAVPAGACLPAGETCAADGDCCGARCEATAGTNRCVLLAGCRVRGEMCVKNEDCCSQRCEAGTSGVQTCVSVSSDSGSNVDGPVND